VGVAVVKSGATKTVGPSTNNTTAITSDAFDPPPGALLIVATTFSQYTDDTSRVVTSVTDTATGTGTWTQLAAIATADADPAPGGFFFAELWAARAGSSPGTARTITANRTTGNVDSFWAATFMIGYDVNVSYPGTLLASATDGWTTTGTTCNPALSASPNINNAVIACYRVDVDSGVGVTITRPSGWSEIDTFLATFDSRHTVAILTHGVNTTPSATASLATYGFGGVLAELPHIAASAPPTSGAISVVLR
jgi:hypothetical protein